ncbi:hypothetical protein ABR737_00030 [Streptomyces sp. Edi2]|uniref:hypothetical protein n=1 Tax=Streptomyces sp. Edi2 TaxID=3162528 RepID=UPI003305DA47
MGNTVINWQTGATYACPRCNHDSAADPTSWKVFTCCNCGTRFARFPRLQRFLRHVGITCEFCTERHPVVVDGKPFGFLRMRHNGIGLHAHHQVEVWTYDRDEEPRHKDGVLHRDHLPHPHGSTGRSRPRAHEQRVRRRRRRLQPRPRSRRRRGIR